MILSKVIKAYSIVLLCKRSMGALLRWISIITGNFSVLTYHCPAEFLIRNTPPSMLGTVHYQLFGISRWELVDCQKAVWSLARLHGSAGWPGKYESF